MCQPWVKCDLSDIRLIDPVINSRYMDNKEGRVCHDCHPILSRIHELLVEHNALPDSDIKKAASLEDLDEKGKGAPSDACGMSSIIDLMPVI